MAETVGEFLLRRLAQWGVRRVGPMHGAGRDIVEQRAEVERGAAGQFADDGQHRLAVQRRVVEAAEQVDRARTGAGQAHADIATEARVCASHEGRAFLVACRHQLDARDAALERTDDAGHALAGHAVDAPHAPLRQAPEQELADRFRHRCLAAARTRRPGAGHICGSWHAACQPRGGLPAATAGSVCRAGGSACGSARLSVRP